NYKLPESQHGTALEAYRNLVDKRHLYGVMQEILGRIEADSSHNSLVMVPRVPIEPEKKKSLSTQQVDPSKVVLPTTEQIKAILLEQRIKKTATDSAITMRPNPDC